MKQLALRLQALLVLVLTFDQISVQFELLYSMLVCAADGHAQCGRQLR